MTNDEALALVRGALTTVLSQGTIIEHVAEVERALDHISEELRRIDDLEYLTC
jgi:hypothetical protein